MGRSASLTVSIQLVSSASEEGRKLLAMNETMMVSIQLVSSASEEGSSATRSMGVPIHVSIQLVSSASEEVESTGRHRQTQVSFHSISFLSEWGVEINLAEPNNIYEFPFN